MTYNSDVAGVRWLEEHWGEIQETHRFQWVASVGDGRVWSGEDADAIADEVAGSVAAQGEQEADLAYAFVDGQELEPGFPS